MRMAVLMHCGKRIGREAKAREAEKLPDSSLRWF